MTREEFGGPWALLLTQPWGKPYRPETDAVRAKLQFELYWRRLSRSNPVIWQAICEDFAGGSKWPAVDELKQAILNNTAPRKHAYLPEPDPTQMPAPLRAMIQFHRTNPGGSLDDAALAVLPSWLEENHAHDDAAHAEAFLNGARRRNAPGVTKEVPC